MNRHNLQIKRIIVSTVAMAATMLLFAVVTLSFMGTPVPDPLDRLSNIALGALIGLLAKTNADPADGPDNSDVSS